MRFPDCFNVIVVQEAPHIILDDTNWVTSGLSPPSCAAWRHSLGRSMRKKICIIAGSLEELLCVGFAWTALTVAERSLCFRTVFGQKPGLPPSHPHDQTDSQCRCSNCTQRRRRGWWWAFTYCCCCCWHSLEKVTRCYGDNPSQLSFFITNTFL